MSIFLERAYVEYFRTKWKLVPVEGKIWIDGPKKSILKGAGIEVFDTNNCHGNWFYLISKEDFEKFPVIINYDGDLVRWVDGITETFEERNLRLNYPDTYKKIYPDKYKESMETEQK